MKVRPQGTKFEINDKRKSGKFTDMWKLSNNSELSHGPKKNSQGK